MASTTHPVRPHNPLSSPDLMVPSSRGDLQLSESLLNAAQTTQRQLRRERGATNGAGHAKPNEALAPPAKSAEDADGANGRSAVGRLIERIRGRHEPDIVKLEPKIWLAPPAE